MDGPLLVWEFGRAVFRHDDGFAAKEIALTSSPATWLNFELDSESLGKLGTPVSYLVLTSRS